MSGRLKMSDIFLPWCFVIEIRADNGLNSVCHFWMKSVNNCIMLWNHAVCNAFKICSLDKYLTMNVLPPSEVKKEKPPTIWCAIVKRLLSASSFKSVRNTFAITPSSLTCLTPTHSRIFSLSPPVIEKKSR